MRSLLFVLQIAGPDPLLRQPIRRRLLSLIRREPGIHASQICRETGHAWGTVQYHLRLLQQNAMVTSMDLGRERCFFPSGMDREKAGLLVLLRDKHREDLARRIQEQPGLRQVDLCRAFAISRKTFRHTITPLIEAGLVAETKGVQTNRYFPQEGLHTFLESPDHGPDAA